MKKIVLITGTSTGLGLKTSLRFAKEGFTVYATMRDLSKKDLLLNEAKDNNLEINLLQLDVSDSKSIEKCVEAVIEKEGKIDILINNAGAGFVRSTEQASEEEILWVTDVNYHGVVRTTKAVLPFMREAKSGHIINITSVGGLVGQPFNELYCAAKFAVEGYTEGLATYLSKPFGINFSLVEPAGIATEFANSALKNIEKTGGMLEDQYLPILQKYIGGIQQRMATGDTASFQTPEEVADVVLDVAKNPTPPLRVRTSEWANNFCRFKTETDPDGTKNIDNVIEMFL